MSNDTTRTTLSQFIAAHRITMTSERTDHNPAMPDSANMDHWSCVFKSGRKRLTVVFSMGYGHNGKAPKVAEVLDCLSSDAASVEGHDFAEWCSEMGYDQDSRTAERTYNACVRQMRKLGQFLGADPYSDLLWNTERL